MALFGGSKADKALRKQYKQAMGEGLAELRDHVQRDTANVVAGREEIVTDGPAIITGPAGVSSGDHPITSWGWLVLTTTRLNFKRLDGDRVRVAFLTDLSKGDAEGAFDHYHWQDKAQLRNISFGFVEGDIRDKLAELSGG